MDDALEGRDAFEGFFDLVNAGGAFGLDFFGCETDDGEQLVLIEGPAETFAMSVQEAMSAALCLSTSAHATPSLEATDHWIDLSECLMDVVNDLVGAKEEMIH